MQKRVTPRWIARSLVDGPHRTRVRLHHAVAHEVALRQVTCETHERQRAKRMNYVDLSSRTKFSVTGPDRLRYLNGQLTNDLNALVSGHAMYAFVLTAKGKLAGDLYLREVND